MVLLAYSHTMYDYEQIAPLAQSSVIFSQAADILISPLVPLQQKFLPNWFMGVWGYVPLLMNSLLWSTFLWLVIMGVMTPKKAKSEN